MKLEDITPEQLEEAGAEFNVWMAARGLGVLAACQAVIAHDPAFALLEHEDWRFGLSVISEQVFGDLRDLPEGLADKFSLYAGAVAALALALTMDKPLPKREEHNAETV